MPTDIVDLFDPNRGDLLYGFHPDRLDCYEHIRAHAPPQSALKQWVDSSQINWMQVDQYNNTLFAEELFDDSGKIDVGMAANEQPKNDPNDPWVKQHAEKLRESRFSPVKVFDAPQATRDKESVATGYSEKQKNYWLAIRRACKFGIEKTVEHLGQDASIHFLLDMFAASDSAKMKAAARRTLGSRHGPNYFAITYSEIRFVNRNRLRFGGRVHFYYSFQESPAPWDDASRTFTENGSTISYQELWAEYDKVRVDKYYRRFYNAWCSPECSGNLKKHQTAIDQITEAMKTATSAEHRELAEKGLLLLQPDRNRWRAYDVPVQEQ